MTTFPIKKYIGTETMVDEYKAYLVDSDITEPIYLHDEVEYSDIPESIEVFPDDGILKLKKKIFGQKTMSFMRYALQKLDMETNLNTFLIFMKCPLIDRN